MADINLWASDWESSNLADHITGNIGTQLSQDTTVFKNGLASLKSALTSGNQDGSFYILDNRFTWRKVYVSSHHRVSSMPQLSSTPDIFYDLSQNQGTITIELYANNYWIKVGSVLTRGTAVINANEWHQVEVIFDKDASTYGTLKTYVDNTLDASYPFASGDAQPTLTYIYMGTVIMGKGTGNPGNTAWFDNTVFFWSDATTTISPFGALVVSHRLAAVDGTYNDFVGVTDTTNKYNNVKDFPDDGDTTYNYKPILYNGYFPDVAIGAAGVLTGTYKYAYTYYNNVGETLLDSASSAISPSSQQVDVSSITVPAGVHGIVGRKLYRTLAGGTIYYLLTTIADTTTTTYTDNTPDASLGVAAPTANTTGTLTLGTQTSKVTQVASYSSSILGACMFTIRRETTSAQQQVNFLVYFNSTEYTYNDGTIYTIYKSWFLGWDKRPSDGAPWTATDLNNVEIGTKLDGTIAGTTYEERETLVYMAVVTVIDPTPPTAVFIASRMLRGMGF